jgi:hypothetical protein
MGCMFTREAALAASLTESFSVCKGKRVMSLRASSEETTRMIKGDPSLPLRMTPGNESSPFSEGQYLLK